MKSRNRGNIVFACYFVITLILGLEAFVLQLHVPTEVEKPMVFQHPRHRA